MNGQGWKCANEGAISQHTYELVGCLRRFCMKRHLFVDTPWWHDSLLQPDLVLLVVWSPKVLYMWESNKRSVTVQWRLLFKAFVYMWWSWTRYECHRYKLFKQESWGDVAWWGIKRYIKTVLGLWVTYRYMWSHYSDWHLGLRGRNNFFCLFYSE